MSETTNAPAPAVPPSIHGFQPPHPVWDTASNARLGVLLASLNDARLAVLAFLRDDPSDELCEQFDRIGIDAPHRLELVATVIEDQLSCIGSYRTLTNAEHAESLAGRSRLYHERRD